MLELTDAEKRQVNKFIAKYYRKYSIGARDFFDMEYEPDSIYNCDFMQQIYIYLFTEKYQRCEEIYNYFIELLQSKESSLPAMSILEVASGYVPSVAILLNARFKMAKKITCMDPRSLAIRHRNISVKKTMFTPNTDTSKYDLLIAHCPCDAFDDMVDNVLKNPKDMCVQTCPWRNQPFFSQRDFLYYMHQQIDRLSSLEDLGYIVEVDETPAIQFTHAPVVSVLKREHPKIKGNRR